MSDARTSGPAYRWSTRPPARSVETFDFATDAEIESALAAAHAAYRSWRDVPIAERAADRHPGGRAVQGARRPTGRHRDRGDGQAAAGGGRRGRRSAATSSTTSRRRARRWRPIRRSRRFADGKAFVQKLPIGPLLGIMPWNYPFYQIARFAAPNLMLGNTIILKHAESVPKSALAVQEIMDEAGHARRASTATSSPPTSRSSRSSATAASSGVSLTGSERAGSVVAAIAGKNLKKCVLELGGSDAYVVLDTDDVEGVGGPRVGHPDWQHRPGLQLQQADDRQRGHLRRLRRAARRAGEGPASPATRPRRPRAPSPRCRRAGRRDPGRAGAGRRLQGRDAACRRRARRRPGGVLLARPC